MWIRAGRRYPRHSSEGGCESNAKRAWPQLWGRLALWCGEVGGPQGLCIMKGRRVRFPFKCQRFAGCLHQDSISRGATRCLSEVITDIHRELGLLGKCHLFTCPRLASRGQKSLFIRISLNLLPELPPYIQVSDAAHPQLRDVSGNICSSGLYLYDVTWG